MDQLAGKQFKKELIVRSPIIVQQLYQLKENYVSYLNIIIDKEALTQLGNNPKGQVVINNVTIYNYNLATTEEGNRVAIRGDRQLEEEAAQQLADINNDKDVDNKRAAMPNLYPNRRALDKLRNRIQEYYRTEDGTQRRIGPRIRNKDNTSSITEPNVN